MYRRDSPGASFAALTDSTGTPLNTPGAIERSLCLTASLVRTVSYQCGDMVMGYELPSVRVLGKVQAPVLLYNSQFAHPRPLTTLDVAIPSGVTVPDKIEYIVRVGSDTTARGVETIASSLLSANANSRKRIQVGWDASLFPTGVYPIHIEARSYYGSTTHSATVLNTESIVVNRISSPLGYGWAVAGIDQLFFPSDTGQRLWVGGDGSARVFRWKVANTWVADSLERPDTLTWQSIDTTYRRRLSGGATLVFDAQGRHVRTVDPRSYTTRLFYRASSSVAMLDSIQLPRLTTSYRFHYKISGADTTMDTVRAPGASGDVITSIKSDGPVPYQIFDHQGADVYWNILQTGIHTGRIKYVRSRRGLDSYYAYNDHAHLSRLKVTMPSRTDVTMICPVFIVADTIGCGTRFNIVDSAIVALDGPGTDSAHPDIWQYRLGRVGAPSWIRNPDGKNTTIRRDSVRLPAFVTQVVATSGLVTHAKPDSMGNVAEVTMDNPLGSSTTQTTKYLWDLRWDKLKRTINQLNETTFVATYDVVGNVDSIADSRAGSATRFYYGAGADLNLLQVVKPPTRGTADDFQYITYDALGNVTGFYQYTDSAGTNQFHQGTHFTQDAIGRTTVKCSDLDSLAQQFPPQKCLFTTYTVFGQDSVLYEHAPALHGAPEQAMYTRQYYSNEGELIATVQDKPGNPILLATRSAHDKLGRLTEQWHTRNDVTLGDAVHTVYNSAGDAVSTTNRRGQVIAMEYDGMHRLLKRFVPEQSEDPAYPDSSFALTRGPYPLNMSGYITPADTFTFQYDSAGNMISARNRTSHIRRGYSLNGLLKGDTAVINKEGSGTTTYALVNEYDALNRRTALRMPSALVGGDSTLQFVYTAVSGTPYSVTDPLSNIHYFEFNKRGEQTYAALAGGIVETLTYDAVGNVVKDSVFKSSVGVVRKSALTYDPRGKRLSATGFTTFADTSRFVYSGMGHLISSRVSQRSANLGGGVSRGVTVETVQPDVLGNALTRATRDSTKDSTSAGTNTTYAYAEDTLITLDTLWRLRHTRGVSISGTTIRSYHYDADGNVKFYFKMPPSSSSTAHREDRYSWYDAEGKLRAADYRYRKSGADGTTPDVTVEQYLYDALGRRYWVRTDKTCGDGNPQPLCALSTLRRTIWDGDRELMEIQVPAKVPGWDPIGNDTLNADNFAPRFPRYFGVDHNPYFGRVLYIPGVSLDQPVGFIRYNYADRGTPITPPDSLMPMATASWSILWDQQGAPRVWCTTGVDRCTGTREYTSATGSQLVTLSAQTFVLERPRFQNFSWQGTLLVDKADGTRTNFRRNRYYDPTAGQFTQEDPIGLAGGLNLYGFAGGDPVNFSDPFGLCPNQMATGLAALQCIFDDFKGGASNALSRIGTAISDHYAEGGRRNAACMSDAMCMALSFGGGGMAGAAEGGLLRAAVRVEARNLTEQLAMAEARGGVGTEIMFGKIKDSRYPSDQWAKMSYTRKTAGGETIEIHYWRNRDTGAMEGFKYKNP